MLPEVLQQPAAEHCIVLQFPGRRVFLPGLNTIMFRPAVEMEHIDPGMVRKNMPEVHAQDNIVTEQEDLCMGIPVMQPFRPGDQEYGLPGPGYPVDDPVPFANLPGIVLLPAIEDHEIEAFVRLVLGERPRGQWAEHDLRVDDGAKHVHLIRVERRDLPEWIEEPHQRIADFIGRSILKGNQLVPEEGIVRFENLRYVLVFTLQNIVPGNVGKYHKMTEWEEEFVLVFSLLVEQMVAVVVLLARPV